MEDVLAGRTFLLHDRDARFAASFDQMFRPQRLRVIKTRVRAPRANAICERWIGSLRRACLDWTLIVRRPQLEAVVHEYVAHDTVHRPHRSLGLRAPDAALAPLPAAPHRYRSADATGWAVCCTSTRLRRDGIMAPHTPPGGEGSPSDAATAPWPARSLRAARRKAQWMPTRPCWRRPAARRAGGGPRALLRGAPGRPRGGQHGALLRAGRHGRAPGSWRTSCDPVGGS